MQVVSGVLLSTTKNEYVPAVYYVASTKSGLTIFEDELPSEISSWRRLKQYLLSSGDVVTKLRIQTPWQLITCDGESYSYIYHIKKICKSFGDSERVDLNGLSKRYAVMREDGFLDTWTIWETEDWRHLGSNRGFIKELETHTDRIIPRNYESFSVIDIGFIRNVAST